MLYRCFYKWSNSNALLKLYLSLIRPHLEYAVQVWNPYLIKDIQKLEFVRAKVCPKSLNCLKRWNSAYSDLLHSSEVTGLSDRSELLIV